MFINIYIHVYICDIYISRLFGETGTFKQCKEKSGKKKGFSLSVVTLESQAVVRGSNGFRPNNPTPQPLSCAPLGKSGATLWTLLSRET